MLESSKSKNSLMQAAFLMLLTRFGIKSLGVISSLILVRILSPNDFGLIAIVMSVYGFIEIFGLFGFNHALIQKSNATKQDFDVAFSFNFIFGAVAGVFMYLSAFLIADFFENSQMVTPLKYISLMFILNGCNNIRVVEFQKNMDFKLELVFQLLPKVASFSVTMILAHSMRNYMALVYGMLFNSFIIVLLSYVMRPYFPKLTLKGAGELFSFSKWLMFNSFLFFINNNSINMIVGKYISTKASGLYSISQEIASLPLTEIAAPINKASFAAYSNVKENLKELTKLFTETSILIAFLSLPVSAGLFMVADYFVPVVLGDKWVEATLLIKYISIVSFVAALSANSGYVFMAIGKPKITFLLSLFRAIIFIILLYMLVQPNDIASPAKAMLIATTIATIVSYWAVHSIARINLFPLLKGLSRPFLSAIFMCLILKLVDSLLINSDLSSGEKLLLEIVVGGISYTVAIVVLWLHSGHKAGIELSLLNKVGLMKNKADSVVAKECKH